MARLTDQKRNGKYPFTYIPAAQTDIAATFKRVRAGLKAADSGSGLTQSSTVRQLRREK